MGYPEPHAGQGSEYDDGDIVVIYDDAADAMLESARQAAKAARLLQDQRSAQSTAKSSRPVSGFSSNRFYHGPSILETQRHREADTSYSTQRPAFVHKSTAYQAYDAPSPQQPQRSYSTPATRLSTAPVESYEAHTRQSTRPVHSQGYPRSSSRIADWVATSVPVYGLGRDAHSEQRALREDYFSSHQKRCEFCDCRCQAGASRDPARTTTNSSKTGGKHKSGCKCDICWVERDPRHRKISSTGKRKIYV